MKQTLKSCTSIVLWKHRKRNDCSGLAINGSFPEEVIFVLRKMEGKYCRWKKWHEEREWRRTHPEFGQDWNLECLEGCRWKWGWKGGLRPDWVCLKCRSNTCTLYLYYKHMDSLSYSEDNTPSISFDYLDGLDLWVSLSIPEWVLSLLASNAQSPWTRR